MRSSAVSFRLSIDEVALVLAHTGSPELARQLLFAGEDRPNADIGQGRLVAAGHSLLARDLADVDPAGVLEFDPQLLGLVAPLAGCDFSIRVTTMSAQGEKTVTYHFLSTGIVEHRVERELVHELKKHADAGSVTGQLSELFGASDIASFEAPESVVPPDILDRVRAESDEAAARAILAEAGVREPTRDIFLRDFRGAELTGTVLRVDYGQAQEPRSDFGLVTFRGPEHLWLIRAEPAANETEARLTIMPGDERAFAREINRLITLDGEAADA